MILLSFQRRISSIVPMGTILLHRSNRNDSFCTSETAFFLLKKTTETAFFLLKKNNRNGGFSLKKNNRSGGFSLKKKNRNGGFSLKKKQPKRRFFS